MFYFACKHGLYSAVLNYTLWEYVVVLLFVVIGNHKGQVRSRAILREGSATW